MRRFLTYVLSVLLVCGCGLEGPEIVSGPDSVIEFTSSKMRIITKGGDEVQRFADGTKFRLFAVQNVSGGSDWSASSVKLYDIEGTGADAGKVDYSIMVDGVEKKASYDVGKNLDFYGVTYGTQEDVPVEGSAGEVPSVSVSLAGGRFPDLMYSSNLKNRNSSSGLLNMEFRHALAKLKFEVLKQDESADSDRKLEDVVLKKVVLKGSAKSASFNISDGSWSYDAGAVGERTVYEDEVGLKVETSALTLKTDGNDVEMLVVPNAGQLMLEVTVDMDGNAATADDVKAIDFALMSSETDMLELASNHEYTLSIVVLKNDVRIVTVTPKVYDWIDVDLGEVAYFGQPVYFGGLMWMDRNLGATSADCENDWYHTLGYYYQFGRNIPYMLDMDHILSNGKTSFLKTAGVDDNDPASEWNMRFLYTYDDKGRKVTTARYADHPSGNCYYDRLAKNPGDSGDYSFIIGYVTSTYTNRTQSWAITPDSYFDNENENQTYWNDVDNQPCPKGWRLPTKDDLYVFMPEDRTLMWEDEYVSGQSVTSRNYHIYSEDAQNIGKWDYRWSYFAGRYKVDPDADESLEYSLPVSSGDKETPRVYGIKYTGTGKAYRVMFEMLPSRSHKGKDYVRISRFETYDTDEFRLDADGKRWNLHKFDWTTPAEYMDIPLCGYIYKSLNMDGAILRTSDAHEKSGLNWVMYLRSGSNGVCVTHSSRRNLGENIRCVRDVNAK